MVKFMKRIVSVFVILVTLLTLMSSCSLLPEEWKTCTVEFYVGDELYDKKIVMVGNTINPPADPKRNNEIFVGWTSDTLLSTKRFDFSNVVTGNLKLQAEFALDAVAFTNMITSETLKSIVMIENKCYNTAPGSTVETTVGISQGSGVVIDISGGYCYVLTNYHVVEKAEGYAKQSFTVEDPWGERHVAQIYVKNSQAATSVDYDLALICFKYSVVYEDSLQEISFGSNPKKNDYVATLGAPRGLQNAISYGKVLQYDKINAGDDSSLQQVSFDIIVHDAPIDHGSSGGALIDTSGRLVGINFAGYNNGSYGCTIPIEKVEEFLDIFVY